MAHNRYQVPGGEDNSFKAESNLLEDYGHEVIRYTMHNKAIDKINLARVALKSIWNQEVYSYFTDLLRNEKPDVVHFQNIFPLISPSAYYAAQNLGVPVIQTLRNYRLSCPSSDYFRDGEVCELCKNKSFPYPAIRHKCYKDSYMGSATVTTMLGLHNMVNTWSKQVTCYIALTKFARKKYIEGGLPESKIELKPNFISEDFGMGSHQGGFALFVGRLSKEKGLETLIEAWQMLEQKFPLKIVGKGPLHSYIEEQAHNNEFIEFLGYQPNEKVRNQMKEASAMVFPSEWYEGMPRTILEAFSVGLPVISSKIGSMESMIKDEKNGLHFKSGDSADLSDKVIKFLDQYIDDEKMMMSARSEYEKFYTPETNYDMLLKLYENAIHKN